jgi:hypothetical protein
MDIAAIREELADIKRELDRRERRGAPHKDTVRLRERIAAIEKQLDIEDKKAP